MGKGTQQNRAVIQNEDLNPSTDVSYISPEMAAAERGEVVEFGKNVTTSEDTDNT